jgi:hypothetical protein
VVKKERRPLSVRRKESSLNRGVLADKVNSMTRKYSIPSKYTSTLHLTNYLDTPIKSLPKKPLQIKTARIELTSRDLSKSTSRTRTFGGE